MRDPNRIHKVLDIVRRIWEKHPDLRLMQLLENCVPYHNGYGLEDDELIAKLKALYNED